MVKCDSPARSATLQLLLQLYHFRPFFAIVGGSSNITIYTLARLRAAGRGVDNNQLINFPKYIGAD